MWKKIIHIVKENIGYSLHDISGSVEIYIIQT